MNFRVINKNNQSKKNCIPKSQRITPETPASSYATLLDGTQDLVPANVAVENFCPTHYSGWKNLFHWLWKQKNNNSPNLTTENFRHTSNTENFYHTHLLAWCFVALRNIACTPSKEVSVFRLKIWREADYIPEKLSKLSTEAAMIVTRLFNCFFGKKGNWSFRLFNIN